MSPKNACLFLILILVSTWTDRLTTGDFFVAPPTGTPSFGQEIYPFAMRDRDETRQIVEAPRLAQLSLPPFALVPQGVMDLGPAAAFPRLVSGAHVCYLFMSLQR